MQKKWGIALLSMVLCSAIAATGVSASEVQTPETALRPEKYSESQMAEDVDSPSEEKWATMETAQSWNSGQAREEQVLEGEWDGRGLLIQEGGTQEPESSIMPFSLYADVEGFNQTVLKALQEEKDSVDVSSYNIPIGSMRSLYLDLIDRNPYLFNVTGYVRYYYNQGTGCVLKILPEYGSYTAEDKAAYERAVQKALQSVNDLMSSEEKALALHDYLVQYNEYDYSYNKYNAYNALVEGSSVCQGYTLAYADLLRRCGIEYDYARSEAMNHIWNYVKIDNSWYHVDATFDDPDWSGGYHDWAGYVGHENFLRSDTGIAYSSANDPTRQVHYDWEARQNCNSVKYDKADWQNYNTAFLFDNQGKYYLSVGNNLYPGLGSYGKTLYLMRCTYSGEETIVGSVPMLSNKSYTSSFIGCAQLTRFREDYYFSTADTIYCYSPDNGKIMRVYTNEGNDPLVGFKFYDNDTLRLRFSTGNTSSSMAHEVKTVPASNYTGLVHQDDLWLYYQNGRPAPAFTGLVKNPANANWYYIQNGELKWGYTGLVQNPGNGTWYYVRNSELKWGYTGLACNQSNKTWYYVENSELKWGRTGLVYDKEKSTWYYVENSTMKGNYTGLVKNPANANWYYVQNSKLIWGFNGIVKHSNGIQYWVRNSELKWGGTALVYNKSDKTWYYVENSEVKHFTGLVKNPANANWYYVQNSIIKWGYEGLAKHTNGKTYYIRNSELKWGYNGLAYISRNKAWYYMKNSEVDWNYNGTVKDTNGKAHKVVNGVAQQ